MKGVLMKAGQLVSFIVEALPEEAQQALATLQADAAPMAPSLAAERGRGRSSGADPERVFSTWGDMPVAAASIGQVHRAATRDGRDVAVKVQYPGVSEAIEEDLDAAEVMYAMFSAMMLKGLDAKALVDELRARMREELDYRARGRATSPSSPRASPATRGCASPRWSRSSRPKVLTTEWIDGHVVGRVPRPRAAPTKQRAAEVIWRFAQHAVLRVGVFNGDPHPGNYRFHHDGSVTFLDFGLVKRWDAGRVGAPRADAGRDRRRPRPGRARRGDGGGRLPRARPRARRRAGVRVRVDARTRRTSSTSSRSRASGCATRSGGSSTSRARTPT